AVFGGGWGGGVSAMKHRKRTRGGVAIGIHILRRRATPCPASKSPARSASERRGIRPPRLSTSSTWRSTRRLPTPKSRRCSNWAARRFPDRPPTIRAECRPVRDSTLVAWYRSLYAPRTGGAYDSHHRTAGIAGCPQRRGNDVAARGARANQTCAHWLVHRRTAPLHRWFPPGPEGAGMD